MKTVLILGTIAGGLIGLAYALGVTKGAKSEAEWHNKLAAMEPIEPDAPPVE
jgi:hypothetical protein